MLVLAVISVEAYHFLAFSDLTCHFDDTGIGGSTVLPHSKETELGSSNQEASPSTDKNNEVVLVPCLHMKVHPYSSFWWCQYF